MWFIVAILIILWALGFFTHVSIAGMTGIIHILLVIAIVIVLIRVIRGERPI